jgi:acyl-CoA synthetase (AMP-forming)/AMP-acid ligase II
MAHDVPFWEDLGRYGDQVAFVDDEGGFLTYRDLIAATDVFAGIPSRRPVLLALDNSLPAMSAYLGALRAGLPAIVVNAGDPTATKRLIETFQPSACWTPERGLERFATVPPECHSALAVMLATSGSTGATKLVRLSRTAVDANARSIASYLALNADERPITTLPPGYSYGLSIINSHLAVGATIILNDHSVIDPAFRALVDKERATSLAGVPYTYELLTRAGLLDPLPSSIRTMTQAGGKMASEHVAAIATKAQASGRRFFVMYGQTEATARMAYLPPECLPQRAGCIGRPIPGGRFTLVDPETGEERDTAGELVYSGPNVMMGYAETVSDLARGPEVECLHTGDLAERIAPDLYRITGRKSRFLKLFGLRISLDEIESILGKEDLTAIATGDDQLLVVGLTRGEREVAERILDDRLNLPASSRIVLAIEDAPHLPSGKIDFVSLLAIGRAAWTQGNSAERGDADIDESPLRASFRRALNRRTVRAGDSFSSLAGDSLAYVEVSMAIEDALGELPTHWEHLTIGEIECLSAARGGGAKRNFRWVSTEMLIRPIAILLIVVAHGFGAETGHLFQGGALMLLMTAGYNSSRFQRDRMIAQGRWALVWHFFARLIVPYYLILAIYEMASHNHIGWRTIILINTYWRDPGIGINSMVQFWFIQALFHCVVLAVLLFQIGPIRRVAQRTPWRFALTMTAGAWLLKVGAAHVLPAQMIAYAEFRTDAWAYAFALGWLANAAESSARKWLAVTIGFVLVGLDWGFVNTHSIAMLCAMAAILFLPRIRLWTPLAQLVAFLAQATFYIYLTQGLAINLIRERLHIDWVPLMVLVAVIFGSVAFLGWQALLRRVGPDLTMRLLRRAVGTPEGQSRTEQASSRAFQHPL